MKRGKKEELDVKSQAKYICRAMGKQKLNNHAARMTQKLTRPFEDFLAMESSGGILLIFCTLIALFWANSQWHESYFHLLHTNLGFVFGEYQIQKTLHHWINDGLMAIFFFVVGLEIKKELVDGELSSPQKAALPLFAAIGGMVAPALIYFLFNPEGVASRGWGIPMATDIAFAVGILSLLGKRAPYALKIFLLALAIVDDLGAVLVIAIFYTEKISLLALLCAALFLGLIFFLRRAGIRSLFPYIILAILSWYSVLLSGVHATIAGVLLGFLTPSQAWYVKDTVYEKIEDLSKKLLSSLKSSDIEHTHKINHESQTHLHELDHVVWEATSPLDRTIHILHPWVSFLIMPIFALANAGVRLESASFGEILGNTISQGVALGLFIGKPLGIVGFCLLAIKLKLGQLPRGLTWTHMVGAGCFGGIGFTMALFVSGLALGSGNEYEVFSKIGILSASVFSVIAGSAALLCTKPQSS